MRTNFFSTAAALISGLVLSVSAHAGLYSFNFESNNHLYEVIGQITTSDTVNAVGGYDILGVSGSVQGAGGGQITGLIENAAQPYVNWNYNNQGFYFNNVMHDSAPNIDYYGMLFTTSANTVWNLFSNSTTDYELYSYTANGGVDVHGSYEQTAMTSSQDNNVPEPSTLALLGLSGLVFSRRRR